LKNFLIAIDLHTQRLKREEAFVLNM
jgi:hypothetical protein